MAARRLRSCSHWPAKFETIAVARGSASIRFTCRSSTAGWRSSPRRAASTSSSSGMLLHRKNDRREASSMSLIACAVPAGPVSSCSARKMNLGLVRMLRSARLDAAVEGALLAAGLVEAEQPVDLGGRHRTAVGAACQRLDDPARAGRFLRLGPRTADEDAIPARRAAETGGVERTGDADVLDVRHARVVRRVDVGALELLETVPALRGAASQEGGRQRVRPRGDGDAHGQPGADVVQVVGGVVGRADEVFVASDRREMDPLPVQQHFHTVLGTRGRGWRRARSPAA